MPLTPRPAAGFLLIFCTVLYPAGAAAPPAAAAAAAAVAAAAVAAAAVSPYQPQRRPRAAAGAAGADLPATGAGGQQGSAPRLGSPAPGHLASARATAGVSLPPTARGMEAAGPGAPLAPGRDVDLQGSASAHRGGESMGRPRCPSRRTRAAGSLLVPWRSCASQCRTESGFFFRCERFEGVRPSPPRPPLAQSRSTGHHQAPCRSAPSLSRSATDAGGDGGDEGDDATYF